MTEKNYPAGDAEPCNSRASSVSEAAEDVPVKKKSPFSGKILWTLVFVLIAGLTVWSTASINQEFSVEGFLSLLGELQIGWIIAAFVAMIGVIVFEGLAILCICRIFGYKKGFGKGYSYAAADIYFSAITPSATGGQPASAFLMMKDGIPGSVTTVALLLNLIMYTFSILLLGLISFLTHPAIFLHFSPVSRVLIVVGSVAQVFLAIGFILLLKKPSILYRICDFFLRLLRKLHLIRNIEGKRIKLQAAIDSMDAISEEIEKNKKRLFFAFLFNVLQRASLLAVTVFVFLATKEGTLSMLGDIWSAECMVVLGSNVVPIPGAMGVIDYLLIDAFQGFITMDLVVNLELMSRAVSFYFCVFLCGISFLLRCLFLFRRDRKKE